MTPAVGVQRGTGARVGNVEFLCLSEHSPQFNLSEITMAPTKHGPSPHVHDAEDDAFYVLESELTFEETDRAVRVLNIHAPAGFDKRLLEG